MSIYKILKESLGNLYQTKVLVKVTKDFDRSIIFNSIRAIPNVVIVKPQDSDYLNSKETADYGYSYVILKYKANSDDYNRELKKIKHITLFGDATYPKAEGVLAFKVLEQAKQIK